mmetsp:Transcript_14340/g.36634  ORF Transcript_14340/g.36634 Transcript_14340/m.36634 type:complete len:419 (-) Transcript_14340:525-1781(-)
MSSSQPVPDGQYRVKKVRIWDHTISICLQNTNGPCPLLAIANALLLRGDIVVHPDLAFVGEEQLFELLGGYLAERASGSQEVAEGTPAAVAALPRLAKGANLNVIFADVCAFEYTEEIAVFDIFKMKLVHGWVVDPQDLGTAAAFGRLSFNQVMDVMVQDSGDDGGRVAAFREFLDANPTQMTHHGLAEIHAEIKEGEFRVLFRNNHFSTLTKHEGALYTLMSDLGFLNEPNVVWESLNDIEGNSTFVNGSFQKYEPGMVSDPGGLSRGDFSSEAAYETHLASLSADAQLALKMQENEQRKAHAAGVEAAGASGKKSPARGGADEELARKLQGEEKRRAKLANAGTAMAGKGKGEAAAVGVDSDEALARKLYQEEMDTVAEMRERRLQEELNKKVPIANKEVVAASGASSKASKCVLQ